MSSDVQSVDVIDVRVALLAGLLVLAGCTGAPSAETPTPEPETFTLHVESAADERVVVTVHLVETLEGVAVDYADGRTERFEGVTDPADLPTGALADAARVRPIGTVTDATALDLGGGPGTVEMPLTGQPRFALYVVSDPGPNPPGDATTDDGPGQVPGEDARVREFGVARCDPGGVVDSLTVRVLPDGVSTGHSCSF